MIVLGLLAPIAASAQGEGLSRAQSERWAFVLDGQFMGLGDTKREDLVVHGPVAGMAFHF